MPFIRRLIFTSRANASARAQATPCIICLAGEVQAISLFPDICSTTFKMLRNTVKESQSLPSVPILFNYLELNQSVYFPGKLWKLEAKKQYKGILIMGQSGNQMVVISTINKIVDLNGTWKTEPKICTSLSRGLTSYIVIKLLKNLKTKIVNTILQTLLCKL